MTSRTPLLPLAVLIAAIAFMLAPWFSSEFAGYKPEQFPIVQDFWPVQPAGWAFGIWIVIYVWLIVGSAWGLIKAPAEPEWQAMRPPLLASLTVGIFWVAAATMSPILATVMIVVMAALAIVAMLRAGNGDRAWKRGPVGLYAGWLTAASGVGTGVVLSGYGVLSPVWAAIVMLVLVLIVTLAVQARQPRAWTYPAGVIWALLGVAAANLSDQGSSAVLALAVVGLLLLLASTGRHARAARDKRRAS